MSRIPSALKEVWKWKEELYQETKDLSWEEFTQYIEDRSKKCLLEIGIK